jgi:putative acetyltransferase
LLIRDEALTDAAEIGAVIAAAFAGQPYSDGREPRIVQALRRAAALTISLVVEDASRIVGHIAFSPLKVGDARDWFALGPLAVLPEVQRRGFGTALLGTGLERLRMQGAKGCALVGEPAFYRRFGFRAVPGVSYAGVPDEYVLCLPMAGKDPVGVLSFHPGFDVAT